MPQNLTSTSYSRRHVIKAGAAALVPPGALGHLPRMVHRSAAVRVTAGALTTGVSVILNEYMQAKRFDLKNDIDITTTESYPSLATYYNDFAAGTFDLAIGSWDSFAEMYGKGVPIRLVCTAASAQLISIVAAKSGPATIDALKGKRLAAVQASGAYKLSKVVIRDLQGIELEKDVIVDNVSNPAQAITILMADRAAAALSWEPVISAGLAQMPAMTPIFNLGAAYRQARGRALPYFVYAVRAPVLRSQPDVAARIAKSYADCMTAMMADPREAIALAAPKMQLDAPVLQAAFTSGRLAFAAEPMSNPPARQTMLEAINYIRKNGGIDVQTDDGFFATDR